MQTYIIVILNFELGISGQFLIIYEWVDRRKGLFFVTFEYN